MEATIKDLQRNTGRVTEAIARRETVHLTRHGEDFATIEATPRGMSGAEFLRRWKERTRIGREIADEVVANIKATKKAK